MNKDQIEGNYEQFKGKVKELWGKLTDDDITLIKGSRQKFLGKVQEQYGIAKEEAEERLQKLEASFGGFTKNKDAA